MIRKPSSLWLSLLLLNETPLSTGTAIAQDGMPAPATRVAKTTKVTANKAVSAASAPAAYKTLGNNIIVKMN